MDRIKQTVRELRRVYGWLRVMLAMPDPGLDPAGPCARCLTHINRRGTAITFRGWWYCSRACALSGTVQVRQCDGCGIGTRLYWRRSGIRGTRDKVTTPARYEGTCICKRRIIWDPPADFPTPANTDTRTTT